MTHSPPYSTVFGWIPLYSYPSCSRGALKTRHNTVFPALMLACSPCRFATREWRPLVSFELALRGEMIQALRGPAAAAPTANAAAAGGGAAGGGGGAAGGGAGRCGDRSGAYLNWAGAFEGGISGPPERLRAAGSGRGGGRRVRLVGRVVRQVKSQLEWTFGEGSAEWRQNVSVHAWLSDTEEAVSVRVYFPTYHGERETFNGFCEDKAR